MESSRSVRVLGVGRHVGRESRGPAALSPGLFFGTIEVTIVAPPCEVKSGMYGCVHLFVHECIRVYVYTSVYMCVCVRMCICVYVYI